MEVSEIQKKKINYFPKTCFHFQNVKGFMIVFCLLFPKNTIVNKNLQTKICTVTTNSFTDEVVNNNEKYISVVKNL